MRESLEEADVDRSGGRKEAADFPRIPFRREFPPHPRWKIPEGTLLQAGSFLSVEKGEYDGYEVLGFFVVRRDFYPRYLIEAHLAASPTRTFDDDLFLADLQSCGVIERVRYAVMHMGNWGDTAEDVDFTPPPTEES